MDIANGDVLLMKKNHPCGGNRFIALRTGMDFKVLCETCGHEMWIKRAALEKNVKKILSNS